MNEQLNPSRSLVLAFVLGLFTLAATRANAQCVTTTPAVTPPENPCCPGYIYGAFAPVGGQSIFGVRYINETAGTTSMIYSTPWNGSGWDYALSAYPGTYTIEALGPGYEMCASFSATVPAHQEEDVITAELGRAELASDPCTAGVITIGFALPNTQCLPAPTARLDYDGGFIQGVQFESDSFSFSGVPNSGSLVAQVYAGCLAATVNVPTGPDVCPSLGGTPSTEDGTTGSPGSISGVVPQLACPVAVAVVAVQGGTSMTVVWDDDTHWHVSAPAGLYAVAIGTNGGVCVEEHVVEVAEAPLACAVSMQPLDPVPQSQFDVANGALNFMLTFYPEYSGGTLQVRNAQGAMIAELMDPSSPSSVGQLFAGTYSLRFISTTPVCASDLGSLTVPCAARRFLYADADGDGFGDMVDRISSCVAVPGYTQDSLDCDVAVHNATGGALYAYDGDNDNVYGVRRVYCGTAPDGYVPAATMPNGPDCNDGDATITSVVGASCTDDEPCTVNDTWGSDCVCSGDESPDTDGDGLCDAQDNCNGEGTTGSSCDDDDGATINDQLTGTGDCTCVGTPCDQSVLLSIAIRTDGRGEDIAWTVRHNASGETVCSGDTLDNNTTVAEGCCVQAGGCYKLTVTDAGGNGIYRGGYVVRMGGANGPRLIDNTDNFRTGSVSTMSGLESFCFAMGPVALAGSSCDKVNWVKGQQLACEEHPSVSAAYIHGAPLSAQSSTVGYEFWIFDPNGSFSQHYFRSHAMANQRVWAGPGRAAHLPINKWDAAVAPHIPGNKLLNVRVRPVYPGSTAPYGPACRFRLDPSREECPMSSLLNDPSNPFHSCGVERARGGALDVPNWLHATAVHYGIHELSQALDDKYQFRFRNVADGYDTTVTSNTSHISLGWRIRPLVVGRTYDVDVRVSKDGGATWCAGSAAEESWGEVCTVTITGGGSGLVEYDGTIAEDAVDVILYPDPVGDGRLFIHGTGLPPTAQQVEVDIHTMTGERVHGQLLPIDAGILHTRLDLPTDMAPGVYLVVLRAEGERITRRVVVN